MDKLNRQARRQQIKEYLNNWRISNLSQKDYCSQNNLNYHTFNIWVKKFGVGTRPRKRAFVALRINDRSQADKGSIAIRYPNGVHLTVPAAMDIQRVIELIRLF